MIIRIELARTRGLALRFDLARFLPSIILAGYGIFILSLFVRHIMTWYINPGYVAPTTLAGAVLIGLAATRLIKGPSAACADEDRCNGECSSGESSPRVWGYAALALPLLLALVFPPRGLASFSAAQRGPQIVGMSAIHGSTIKRVSLSVDTRSFTMMDWVGALSADPNPKDYLGKPVSVTGMVLHDPGSVPSGDVMVLRYLVTCCIADARPVGLIVRDTSHGALKDNQWVTVTGTMAQDSTGGQKVAVVAPKQITVVKSGNPYIY